LECTIVKKSVIIGTQGSWECGFSKYAVYKAAFLQAVTLILFLILSLCF